VGSAATLYPDRGAAALIGAIVTTLVEIEAIDHHLTGRFQTDAYHYERDGEREPVTLQRARSLIVERVADDEFPAGEVTIRGVAWSGAAPIARVEVSVGAGPWQQAQLLGERSRYAWLWWEPAGELNAVA
jgi:molybdenum-dependent oxidoreductase-like protein